MIVESTSVLVPPAVCARLTWLVDAAKRAAVRDATSLHADVVQFLDEIERVGRAYRFHAANLVASTKGISEHSEDLPSGTVGGMDINAVAGALGCTPRNALDLVKRHALGRKVGGRWLVDVVDFDEFARGRREQS